MFCHLNVILSFILLVSMLITPQAYSASLKDESALIGEGCEVRGEHCTAMGLATVAEGDYSTAMGSFTATVAESSTAMGFWSSTDDGFGSTAIGKFTSTTGYGALAMENGVKSALDSFWDMR